MAGTIKGLDEEDMESLSNASNISGEAESEQEVGGEAKKVSWRNNKLLIHLNDGKLTSNNGRHKEFTQRESELLIQLVRERMDSLNKNYTDHFVNEKVWTEIAGQFARRTDRSDVIRSAQLLMKKWHDMIKIACRMQEGETSTPNPPYSILLKALEEQKAKNLLKANDDNEQNITMLHETGKNQNSCPGPVTNSTENSQANQAFEGDNTEELASSDLSLDGNQQNSLSEQTNEGSESSPHSSQDKCENILFLKKIQAGKEACALQNELANAHIKLLEAKLQLTKKKIALVNKQCYMKDIEIRKKREELILIKKDISKTKLELKILRQSYIIQKYN